jgi:hypothetical protein
MYWKKGVLIGVDVLLANFVLFPCIICYWRGVWQLYDMYVFPSIIPLSDWVTITIGAVSLAGYFLYPLSGSVVSQLRDSHPVWCFILTRVSFFIYAPFQLAVWNGVWGLADYYLTTNPSIAAGALLCGYVVLVVLRTSRSVLYPPVIVVVDTRDDALQPNLRFDSQVTFYCRLVTF